MVFLLLSFVLKVPNMMESSEIEIVSSALPVRTGYGNLYLTLSVFFETMSQAFVFYATTRMLQFLFF